jgi:hypothetical protein
MNTHKEVERLFRFHWRSGKPSEGRGRDVADAFSRLGYGAGAVRALDYYEIVSEVQQPGDTP